MRFRSTKFSAWGLVVLLCTSYIPAFATDTNADVIWFANLVSANNGKTFCAPKGATIKDVAVALSEYSKAHPELNDRFNDMQAVRGLAERYPCTVTATSSLINTPLSEADKNGVRNVTVEPTGEFTSVDTKPGIAIIRKLHDTSAHENDALVDQIVTNAGDYMPPVLLSLADLLYRRGEIGDAIFWLNAARLRAYFDASICTDTSVRSAVSALTAQIPRALLEKQFDDIPQLTETIDRVLAWDAATPYNYDHRWISLHGMRAMMSGLGKADEGRPLTVPKEMWEGLMKQNRGKYRDAFAQAIDTVQKQRSEVKTSQSAKPNEVVVPSIPVSAGGG